MHARTSGYDNEKYSLNEKMNVTTIMKFHFT